MATNQTGIAIVIKAFLPTGKTLDDQYAALTLVKEAHASGDYAALLAASTIDAVKTEQKTRRVEEAAPEPAPAAPEGANVHGIGPDTDGGPNSDYQPNAEAGNSEPGTVTDDNAPAFLKKGKKAA